ncbi:CTLH/CRA C-terminal to lish motif domain-containing protein [Amylostereum chailletii]|nr:CTLH/CRA C-terminal to lish motif domain-containing protein [Amylostereum chailletii]
MSPSPFPSQRPLVLDYLTHNCYSNTATSFANDSLVKHLDADGDLVVPPPGQSDSLPLSPDLLAQVRLRARSYPSLLLVPAHLASPTEIQSSILSGRVDDAIQLLNRHFPAVLAPSSADPPPPNPAKPSAPSDTLHSIIPFSFDPSCLFLDLRILAFLEACRTVPLDPKNPTAPASEPDTSSTIPDPTLTPTPDADLHLARLLKHVQELFALAQSLDSAEDRTAYQHELGKISTVLGYKVPEDSPSAKYLAHSRRVTVANEINSAILYRLGLSPVSKLELYVRYTTALWNYMNEKRYKAPTLPAGAAGIQLPPRRKSSVSAAAPGVSASRDDVEIIPSFDLGQFLSS